LGPEAPKTLARAFARLAWPAYGVLVVTGFWNISTFHWAEQSSAWKAILIVKIVVVSVAGEGAFLHGRATSRQAIAAWGSVSGLASVAALVMGSCWPAEGRTSEAFLVGWSPGGFSIRNYY
jgi:hypothetical protein